MMMAISSSSDVVMFGGSESVTLFGLFPPERPNHSVIHLSNIDTAISPSPLSPHTSLGPIFTALANPLYTNNLGLLFQHWRQLMVRRPVDSPLSGKYCTIIDAKMAVLARVYVRKKNCAKYV